MKQTFISHLEELRYRLIFIVSILIFFSVISYFFMDKILLILIPSSTKLIFISPFEAFVTRIKASFYIGFFLTLPIHLFHIWKFILPGLYENEIKYLKILLGFSYILFILGILFAFQIVFPVVLNFLSSFETEYIKSQITFNNYISFLMKFLLAFGLMFQLPVIVFFLAKLKIVDKSFFIDKRKYAICIIFIISAILTPPDVFSQLMIAIPTYIIYELSLFFIKIWI